MKILILCRYTRLGASSRVRLYQFIPSFEAAGITCEVQPLLNDRYLKDLYARKPLSRWNLAKAYATVLNRLRHAKKYDCILIEKEIFPYLPAFAERWLNIIGVPYAVDYDDAIFHNYNLHPNPFIRLLLGNKIARVMRHASLVVCGNVYLRDYAIQAGASRVTIIPTVIDTDKYPAKTRETAGPVVIGWIGSPTSVKYLRKLQPLLASLAERYEVRVHLVGAMEGIGLGPTEKVVEWSEAGEAAAISAFDIGIMPLEDSPWERGKCGYKLIQYMGGGLPVVGSPVGVNEEIIQEGVTGYKPTNETGWSEALEELILDATLRRRLGENGRALAIERYSLDAAAAIWIQELKNTAMPQARRQRL